MINNLSLQQLLNMLDTSLVTGYYSHSHPNRRHTNSDFIYLYITKEKYYGLCSNPMSDSSKWDYIKVLLRTL